MDHAIYLDLECILSEYNTCANNPNNSYSKTISTHEVSGYSIFRVNRHGDNYQLHYRREDCISKLACELMTIGKEIAKKEKKDEEQSPNYEKGKYEKSEYCHICHTRFTNNDEIDEQKNKEEPDKKRIKFLENFKKVKGYDYYTGEFRGSAHLLCSSRYQEHRNIPVIIHNGSNYDFHFIIKELAKKFKSKMRCIGENTETYKTFSVEFQKDENNNENNNEDDNEENNFVKKDRLRFIDRYRFIKSPLDKLVDNLSEINSNTCNKYKERTKTTQYYEFMKLHENRLIYKCLNCKSISFKPINTLITKFSNTYKLRNDDNETFVLLLRKGIYRYEYMDSWNRFNETSLPSKEEFYSS